MTSSRILFWHRRDLRLADNLGLAAAAEISPAVTGVYVLDPQVINPPDHLPPMAPARMWFLIESLIELQQRWCDAGSRLLVLDGPATGAEACTADHAGRWSGTDGAMPANGPPGSETVVAMAARWWWIGISC